MNEMTQKEKILAYLDKEETISPMEAFSHLHITKLSTRIGEIVREDGVPIFEKREGQYMRYSLSKLDGYRRIGA